MSIADSSLCSILEEELFRPLLISTLLMFFVSNFSIYLFSISKITMSLNYFVTFFLYYCTFQDLRTKKRVGLGHKRGKMYLLVHNNVPRELVSSTSTLKSSLLWYFCLDHPFLWKHQQALSWMSIEPFECVTCQLGKHHRTTYLSQWCFVSYGPFELIHSDIWSSCRVS